jgi:hypothetical protein
MNLFKAKPPIEPALPEPDAVTAERAAAAAVREASARCSALDVEKRSWETRRDAAYREFCDALKHHAEAKAALAESQRPTPAIFAGGSVNLAVTVETR